MIARFYVFISASCRAAFRRADVPAPIAPNRNFCFAAALPPALVSGGGGRGGGRGARARR